MRTKPRIRWNPAGREWVCSDNYVYAYGWGKTMEAAYEQWLYFFAMWRRRDE